MDSLSSQQTSVSALSSDFSASQRSFASENTYASSREAKLKAARDRSEFVPKHMAESLKARRSASASSHSGSSSRSSSSDSSLSDKPCKSKTRLKERGRSKTHATREYWNPDNAR